MSCHDFDKKNVENKIQTGRQYPDGRQEHALGISVNNMKLDLYIYTYSLYSIQNYIYDKEIIGFLNFFYNTEC